MSELKQTPLYPIYATHGAKTIDFGGWDLPVQFSSITLEHEAVRTKAGLFDVSHMGEVEVKGEGALYYLQRLTTNDVSKLEDGQAQYAAMCYPDGGTVDDLIIYKKRDHDYLLVINAGNIDKDFAWMQENITENVTVTNISSKIAQLAIQGPLAETILQKMTDVNLQEIGFFQFKENVSIEGINALVSRSGYTGEDGFELYVDQADAIELWGKLLVNGKEDGLVPCGLGARDTLRFEAKLPLYGQELSQNITPIEAGIGFAVKIDKDVPSIGHDVLLEQKTNGAPRKLVGLEMIDRGIPRTHYPVFVGDKQIGEVTTGTQSPTLKKNVGLALIQTAHAGIDNEVEVEIRGKRLRAKIIATPFYKRPKK
ncbi:glycine cleavage system protein T [Brevibacillus laterosporus]|uniref:glycine cleavage system aminomethyltransferase GcvT n=1 Tax=Brevibacillus laterosporus TaxID=1465 RepID=UPI000CE40B5E|nr:glycine cleavage system aminomethyltransferase GcvT [Brevibacillus laterosporus]NKQ19231.1 glycine cleavage system aminomethyltransferase GcvT [Brevibacillus laterosporus]PPA84622.1 glycine cleavage system protein T [Brevibacillus laterosporus]WNX32813.1 glycine cleavage system aminomethyltransferase GcvT [Brevibacillus laterosporus]